MKYLLVLSLFISLPAFSQQLNNLSKDDVKDVTEEFGANFAHTVVAAPETNGGWGVEVGIAGGITASPKFKGVVEDSGGDGKDFKNIYHAGAFARVHIPFDLFAELSVLPEQEFSDVKIKSQSLAAGWNVGGFFNWPVDLALGFSRGSGEVSFSQDADIATSTPAADVKFETTTTIYYAGISKTFFIVTPYIKAGVASIDGDLNATGAILTYQASQKENVKLSGSYLAGGINVNLLFLKIGAEYSKVLDVQRTSVKLSFDF